MNPTVLELVSFMGYGDAGGDSAAEGEDNGHRVRGLL